MVYGVDFLQYEDIIKIINNPSQGTFSDKSLSQIENSRNNVKKIIESGKTVYGINTGFGPLCDTRISENEIAQLQHNLIISHSVGVGESISKDLSKIMLATKIHALSKGKSGISPHVVERLYQMLEKDIIPVIPSQGSVGASGDLAPLAHMVLPLLGLGKVWQENKITETQIVLEQHNLEPIQLGPKDGLALINGTQFMQAHGIWGLDKMKYLLDLADLAAALSLEAFQGSKSPFKKELHHLRPFKGSQLVAERLNKFLENSENLKSHENCDRVQDPYSMRCTPQVHGASRNAWLHLKESIETEINSVTDNPLVISEEEAVSGGNFHGQLIALPLDYATFAAAEIGNISDRRCFLLLKGEYGLPRFLTKSSGLNSGFMIPQYTTAALVTENKTLCFPASADSIPTSIGQEDHVSMGSISGRKFIRVLENLERILAIELLIAAQGIEFRRPNKLSILLEEAHSLIRTKVEKLEDDREIGKDIQSVIELVKSRAFNVAI